MTVCFQISQLLSPHECADFIRSGEEESYQETGRDYPSNYRNNDRIVTDSPFLANTLWNRVSSV